MALFGKTIAIASVGISCQTAHQIEHHHALLEQLAGEQLVKHATPFDWTICAPLDVAGMIRDRETFPNDVSELTRKDNWPKPYWPRRRCWFWHKKLDVPGQFRSHCLYEAQRWEEIRDRPRRLFFLSNTQNNLARIEHGIETALKPDPLWFLSTALYHAFGEHSLHVVSHDPAPDFPRFLTSRKAKAPRWHQIERDGSQWHGSASEWRKVFEAAFQREKVAA